MSGPQAPLASADDLARKLAALRRIALAVVRPAGVSERALLHDLLYELTVALPSDGAMVAVYADESRTMLKTLAARLDGQVLPDFEYPVVGSPCQRVLGAQFRYVARGVLAEVDPRSPFAGAGLDGYAAFPLADSHGQPVGVLAALGRTDPIAGGDAEHAEGVLKVVAGRLAGELERRQALNVLRDTALAVSSARGETIFDELARMLAASLQVEFAFVSRHEASDPGHLTMVALHADGRTVNGLRYAIAPTPCRTVLGQQFRAYPSNLALQFPEDPDVLEKGAESYAGLPLTGTGGEALGVIAVGSRRPLADVAHIEAVLKIFAVRAAAEIERLRALEALSRSEASYRAIFDSADSAIFVHDWDTFALIDVNPRACESHGLTRQQLLSADPATLLGGDPPYDLAHALQHLRRAKLGRCPPFEWQVRPQGGERRWWEIHLKPAQLDGRPCLLAFSHDITERKAAEQRLRDSEAQYRAIFDASHDALILWNARYERVDVNAAYERMYGWRREEVVGRGFEIYSESPAHVEPRRELVRQALAGEKCRAVLEGVHRSGQRIVTEIHTVPFQHRGEPHVLAIARDITERLQLESQLRQAQKMEAIGQLTGGIAHDFNNILTSVLGYVAMAEERAEAGTDERLVRQLGQARAAAERARDLVAQMLAFARRRSGRRQALPPARLVREVADMMRSTLPSSVLLETDDLADVPEVEVDPVQLGQVLMNLAINARDAVEGTGRVGITLRTLQAPAAGGRLLRCRSCGETVAGGRWVVMGVSDNGCGIAPEVLPRMFDPFFSTKPAGRGTGMGLAMVHGIVHDHGGHIEVQTWPGEGSVFSVLLPARRVEPSLPTRVGEGDPAAMGAGGRGGGGAGSNTGAMATGGVASAAAGPATASGASAAMLPRPPALHGRVLLVEDDAEAGDYLRERLQTWGLQVVLQRDARVALAGVADESQAFDLVVTDLTMPHLSGLQLARQATTLRPGLPVVLISGDLAAADTAARRAAGIGFTLAKPLDAAALREVLTLALGGRRG